MQPEDHELRIKVEAEGLTKYFVDDVEVEQGEFRKYLPKSKGGELKIRVTVGGEDETDPFVRELLKDLPEKKTNR